MPALREKCCPSAAAILFVVILIASSAAAVLGQGNDRSVDTAQVTLPETTTKVDDATKVPYICTPTTPKFQDDYNEVFKIKIDTGVSSATHRNGDLVQFSVIDNVMFPLAEDLYKETITISPDKNNFESRTVKCEPVASKGNFYLKIPAGTRGYGKVVSRKARSPLWVNGKAQIFVQIKDLVLSDGTSYSIEFANIKDRPNLLPCNNLRRKKRQPTFGSDTDAPKLGEQCIEGRRPQLDWASIIATPVLGAVSEYRGSDTPSYSLAGITFLQETSGFGGLLNGVDAGIGAGQIFEVKIKVVPKTMP